MKHVQGNAAPSELEFYKAHGIEFARVNVDIQDGEDGMLEWDCYEFPRGDMSDEELIENSEELDAQYSYSLERANMSDADWKNDVDAALLDIMEAVM